MNGIGEREEMNLFNSIVTTHNIQVYLQNMLLVFGYDRLETISHMDASESDQLNDIDGILDYVRKIFPNDARLA